MAQLRLLNACSLGVKSHSSDLVGRGYKMTALLCLGCGEDLVIRALQGPPAEGVVDACI